MRIPEQFQQFGALQRLQSSPSVQSTHDAEPQVWHM